MRILFHMNQLRPNLQGECKISAFRISVFRNTHSLSESEDPKKDFNIGIFPSKTMSKPIPPESSLKFGSVYSDHMLAIEYDGSLGGWQQASIKPLENIRLHPGAKVLQYAVCLFEGMKAYRGTDGKIRLFRPELNLKRLNISAERACLPTIEPHFLLQCIERLISIDQKWVPNSDTCSLYIRPTIISNDPSMDPNEIASKALLYTLLCPSGSYFDSKHQSLKLLANPLYVRSWPNGWGDTKIGANYAPTVFVQNKALEVNCDQVLWLYGDAEELTEGGTMNMFIFYINEDGKMELATPPLNGLILPGITRLSLLELAKEWGEFNVVERKITMPELLKLNRQNRLFELFGSGTACTVCPVSEIVYKTERIQIPTMKQKSPLYVRLCKALNDIQYGKIQHPWSREIHIDSLPNDLFNMIIRKK